MEIVCTPEPDPWEQLPSKGPDSTIVPGPVTAWPLTVPWQSKDVGPACQSAFEVVAVNPGERRPLSGLKVHSAPSWACAWDVDSKRLPASVTRLMNVPANENRPVIPRPFTEFSSIVAP